MRTLLDVLECGEGCATPASTMGTGNPVPSIDGEPGSGDLPTAKTIRRKKKRNQ
jgi:hypothetical protein